MVEMHIVRKSVFQWRRSVSIAERGTGVGSDLDSAKRLEEQHGVKIS
jgi:hypothetical protein